MHHSFLLNYVSFISVFSIHHNTSINPSGRVISNPKNFNDNAHLLSGKFAISGQPELIDYDGNLFPQQHSQGDVFGGNGISLNEVQHGRHRIYVPNRLTKPQSPYFSMSSSSSSNFEINVIQQKYQILLLIIQSLVLFINQILNPLMLSS